MDESLIFSRRNIACFIVKKTLKIWLKHLCYVKDSSMFTMLDVELSIIDVIDDKINESSMLPKDQCVPKDPAKATGKCTTERIQ